MSSHDFTRADCVDPGRRFCPEDGCRRVHRWLEGAEPPVDCRDCGAAMACRQCGTGGPLTNAGRCNDCANPTVTVFDAEFGLRFEPVARRTA